MNMYSLFIVDDEDTIRRTLTIALEGRYRLADFPDAESAVAAARVDPPDLVLLDLGLPGMSGIEAIPVFRAIAPEILIVVITAYEDVKSVVSAMKGGAYDYVVKPLDIDTLEMSIGNALESIRLKKEVQALQERYLRENLPCFIGESNTIRDVMEFVGLLARSPDTPVLILGETGTGKELIASAIHYRSPNFRGPLISVNCAAIPRELIESELFGYEKGAFSGASAAGKKGMVEQAEGGTLFLDEIGDLSPEAQAKLLRFLEEGEYYRVGGTRKLNGAGSGRVRHEQKPRGADQEEPFPGGPLLSPGRRPGGASFPHGAAGRHRPDRLALSPRIQPEVRQIVQRHLPGSPGSADAISLERERPGVEELRGTRRSCGKGAGVDAGRSRPGRRKCLRGPPIPPPARSSTRCFLPRASTSAKRTNRWTGIFSGKRFA